MLNPLLYFAIFALWMVTIVPVLVRFAPVEWLKNEGRNKNLEGLRGLLAPSVLFHHAAVTYFYYKDGVWNFPPSQFYAKMGPGPVLIFFFMTGFLFWDQLQKRVSTWKFGPFLLRRAKRLMPAYYLLLLLLCISVCVLSGGHLRSSPFKIIGELSWWLCFGLPFGHFPNINELAETLTVVAGVVWTLRLEWLFYFALFFLRRFLSFRRFVFLMVVFAGTYVGVSSQGVTDWVSSNRLLVIGLALVRDFAMFMILGFGFGMLASYPARNAKRFEFVSSWWATAIAVLCVIVYYTPAVPEQISFTGSALLGIFFMGMILDQKPRHILKRGSLQLLGHISYGIYLFHGICLFWIFRCVNHWQPVATLTVPVYWGFVYVSGVVAFTLAYVSYRYLELPFVS